MVKKLRKKFVYVTTTLMIVVFGGFLIINTMYNKYWDDIETIEMLDWIADSGIFTKGSAVTDENFERVIAEGESSIVGILLNEDGKIIKKRMLGGANEIVVPEESIQKMCIHKRDKLKIGRYYYSYTKLNDGNTLLVIMDSSMNGHVLKQVVGIAFLSVIGICLLVMITLYLSRFVTKPAEQSLMREKRFISDASHELKTPLGAISINAQAIKMTDEDSLYVNNIINETDRMNRLIEKLLILSKLDEEPETVFEYVNLSEICEEMALTYESVAYEKEIKIEYDIAENITIKGNEDEMRQLMAILIDNGIKNANDNGTVFIKCYEEKKSKIIEVTNTGSGISEENLPHVFERFYTSDTSRRNNSFGLGLAIAKAIVENHKGRINVKSEKNKETTFSIFF